MDKLERKCLDCSGNLVVRPIGHEARLDKNTASIYRIFKPEGCAY